MAVTVGVVCFPGSNCELDAIEALRDLGATAEVLWHEDRDVSRCDAIVLPGGFAHGDYLRTGAIARFSPVMTGVEAFAASGGPVVGICNGFQVLTEAGLLPGALQKNGGLKFICADVSLRVRSTSSPITSLLSEGEVVRIPISHFEGNYTVDPDTLAELWAEERVILTYEENPNGSIDSIAAVCSAGRNVVGLMPHPERACHPLLGGTDGATLLRSLLATASAAHAN